MAYLALARKWRPRQFSELVGQEHVVRALVNALDREQLHHAYLFTGTRGVGKTTIARIFAKALNCEAGVSSTPCGECTSCLEIDEGRFVDLLEVDAASRTKVDDTRELLDNVQYSPTRGRYKIYLIDEVHMLSKHSFNALLKTLEEPPPHVKFLLATTDPQQLPVTVLSRCLQFNLKPLPVSLIENRLAHIGGEDGIEAEQGGLHLLAGAASGSMRDALSLMDQVIAFGDGKITEEDVRKMLGTMPKEEVNKLLQCLADRDGAALLEQIGTMDEMAPDYSGVLIELMSSLRSLALTQVVPEAAGEDDVISSLASAIAAEDMQLYYDIAVRGRASIDSLPDARAAFEMIMLRMLTFTPEAGTSSERVEKPAAKSARTAAAKRAPEKKSAAPKQKRTMETSVEVERPAQATPVSIQDWTALIDSMSLSGAARQLAANCEFLKHEDGVITLRLESSSATLLTDQLKNRLQGALSDHLNIKVGLHVDVGETKSETLANKIDREASDKQKAAESEIASDPNVRAMQEAFGASIQDGSVQPLDER